MTQPRVTCYRVGIRMNEPRMAALLVAHGRPGFYLRVLEEGEVEAGDEIVQVAAGPERMSVAEINALLYKPGHPRDQLQRALRIPALSAGWRGSLQALLDQQQGGAHGNAGLAPASGQRPAWTGFRPLRVAHKIRESRNVISLVLEPADGQPLAAPLPGQFVVLRLKPTSGAPALTRSYSVSGEPSTERYRVSVKREPARRCRDLHRRKAASRRRGGRRARRAGNFALSPGDGAVVFLSAGIGATPVLAMLHALAAASVDAAGLVAPRRPESPESIRSPRKRAPSWGPCRMATAMSATARPIRKTARAWISTLGGAWTCRCSQELGVPPTPTSTSVGRPPSCSALTAGLAGWGVAASRIHTEIFGAGPSMTPGIAASPRRPPHAPAGPPGAGPLVSFARSGLEVRWRPDFQSLLELAEACDMPVRWSCRTGVCHTCETGLVRGRSATSPTRSTRRRTATC